MNYKSIFSIVVGIIAFNTSPVFSEECAKALEQCGGAFSLFPDKPTCCEEGYYCKQMNSQYSICVPNGDNSKLQCGNKGDPCGGSLHKSDPHCCNEGFYCQKRNPFYYACELVPTPTATTPEPTGHPSYCAIAGDACGGLFHPNAQTCCEKGSYCHKISDYHSFCVPYEKNTSTTTSSTSTTSTATPDKECWSIPLGFPCCTMENPKVMFEDKDGKWGVENGNWCGIIEKSGSITTTSTTSTTTTTTTTSTSTSTSTPTQCAKANEACGGSNYPNVPTCCEPGYYCKKNSKYYHKCVPLENNTTTSKEKTTTTTTSTITKPKTTTTTTTTTTSAASTSTPCWSEKLGFPCCSPGNTKVEYEDNDGKWGVENGNWCGMIEGTTGSNCAKGYQPCGGTNFPEITNHCCESGYYCMVQNEHYHQCVPKNALNVEE